MRGTARHGPAYRTPAGGRATILDQVSACASDLVYRPRYRNARDVSGACFGIVGQFEIRFSQGLRGFGFDAASFIRHTMSFKSTHHYLSARTTFACAIFFSFA